MLGFGFLKPVDKSWFKVCVLLKIVDKTLINTLKLTKLVIEMLGKSKCKYCLFWDIFNLKNDFAIVFYDVPLYSFHD